MSLATMTVDREAVFEALDRQRRHQRMTRAALAVLLGISPATLVHWSHGKYCPSGDSLARALAWLDRDLSDFTRDGGP